MAKLEGILGLALLRKIEAEYPELYEQLLEHIRMKKNITLAWCRDLLAQFEINLDEERRLQRLEHGNEHR